MTNPIRLRATSSCTSTEIRCGSAIFGFVRWASTTSPHLQTEGSVLFRKKPRFTKLPHHDFCSLREILLEQPVDFPPPMIVSRVQLIRPDTVLVRVSPVISPARRFGHHRALDFFRPPAIALRSSFRRKRSAIG